ncbi:MAG: LLM class flavin-dependent oxidoreductase [Candidatus Binatia bacterium]|nr:LLM class flavin-dependent oxidoreductase [Candidatus Binatia bacterium]
MSDATRMPSVSLSAMPGRRSKTLAAAKALETAGFTGVYSPTFGDGMAFCEALALETNRIQIGTSIANIYTRLPSDYAQSAAFIQEVSDGRFRFGIGVSHEALNKRLGVPGTGKPVSDMRRFVQECRAVPRIGNLPPIVLAGLRDPMVRLAGEIAEGVVFANVAASHVSHTLEQLPQEKRTSDDFFIGNMIPICISDDAEAAAAVNRKTMMAYIGLPNYRNYWKAAGYVEEMEAIEKARAAKDFDSLPKLMHERWLDDVTLFGSLSKVREGLERWFDLGVRTPILVSSSTSGGQLKAIEELIAAFR